MKLGLGPYRHQLNAEQTTHAAALTDRLGRERRFHVDLSGGECELEQSPRG